MELASVVLFGLISMVYGLNEQVVRTVNRAKNPQPWVQSLDYVRCSCNLPQCVSTGYMCKSASGGCFSHIYDVTTENHKKSRQFDSRHGCLELLTDKETRTVCESGLTTTTPQSSNSATSTKNNVSHRKNDSTLLFCCYHDMCNHMDSPQTKHLINNTLQLTAESTANNVHKNNHSINDHSQPLDCTDSQVWFRAATIAVPICGAVILFILIAVAVKILRGEGQNATSRKLDASFSITVVPTKGTRNKKHQCNYEKISQTPLLIQNELGNNGKNDTNSRQEMRIEMNNKPMLLNIIKPVTDKEVLN